MYIIDIPFKHTNTHSQRKRPPHMRGLFSVPYQTKEATFKGRLFCNYTQWLYLYRNSLSQPEAINVRFLTGIPVTLARA